MSIMKLKTNKSGNRRGLSTSLRPGAGIDYIPTNADRRRVWMMKAMGLTSAEIANCIGPEGISEATLYKYYGNILKTAVHSANGKVARALFTKAINGDVTAQIFWLKTRAGFKETSVHEIMPVQKRIIGIEEAAI